MRDKKGTSRLVVMGAMLLATVIVLKLDLSADKAMAEAPPPAIFSASEQRSMIIQQLGELNDRLGRLEAALSGGVQVRVTGTPTVRVVNPEN